MIENHWNAAFRSKVGVHVPIANITAVFTCCSLHVPVQSAHPGRKRTALNLYVHYLRDTPEDRSAALIRMLEDLKEEYPEQVAATARAAANIAGMALTWPVHCHMIVT
jgi:hypothetical protein